MRITSAERERNTCRGRTEKVRQMEKRLEKRKRKTETMVGWEGDKRFKTVGETIQRSKV